MGVSSHSETPDTRPELDSSASTSAGSCFSDALPCKYTSDRAAAPPPGPAGRGSVGRGVGARLGTGEGESDGRGVGGETGRGVGVSVRRRARGSCPARALRVLWEASAGEPPKSRPLGPWFARLVFGNSRPAKSAVHITCIIADDPFEIAAG